MQTNWIIKKTKLFKKKLMGQQESTAKTKRKLFV